MNVHLTSVAVDSVSYIKWQSKVATLDCVWQEDGSDGLSDGTFDGRRHFTCPPGKAIFVNLSMCRQDRRFLESIASTNSRASIGEPLILSTNNIPWD